MADDLTGGYVMSDKTRRHVFLELMSAPASLDRIVKKQRLIRGAADRAVNELVTRGLVARDPDKGTFALTPAGETLARELKSEDMFR